MYILCWKRYTDGVYCYLPYGIYEWDSSKPGENSDDVSYWLVPGTYEGD